MAQIFIECDVCKEYFLVNRYRKDTARFCSKQCKKIQLSKNWLGENNPNSKKSTRKFKKCQCCNEYYIPRKQREKTSKFCSNECSIKYSKKENHNSWNGGNVEVTCDFCYKKYKVPPCRIKTTNYCSKKCQSNFNKTLVGAKAYHWKGENAKYKKYRDRQSIQYINWRKSIFERDNYTCQMCNNRGGYLEAHHIKKFSTHKKLRFDKINGITLCKQCHQKTKGHEEDYENFFKEIITQSIAIA